MPSKKAINIKIKKIIISKNCRYSMGKYIKDFKTGEELIVDPKLKDGFDFEKPIISEKFLILLKFHGHVN